MDQKDILNTLNTIAFPVLFINPETPPPTPPHTHTLPLPSYCIIDLVDVNGIKEEWELAKLKYKES